MHLYQISNEYQKLAYDIENSEEITIEQIQALDEVKCDIKDKLENIGALIANLEAEENGITEVISRNLERQKKLGSKIDNLKNYVKFELERCGIKKVSTSQFDISVKINPASVVIQDEKLIPERYYKEKTLRSLDKTLISQDMKNDCLVPGAILEHKTRLEIR